MSTRSHTRRRRILLRAGIGLTAVAATVAVAGCGGSSSNSEAGSVTPGKPVTINYWSWVANSQTAVDAFNKAHSDIHVNLTEIPNSGAGGNAKIYAALKAKTAPCVSEVAYQDIPDFLVANGLTDITKYVSSDKSKFVAWQWAQGVYNNKVYAVPQASGPMALYYRTDMFAKAGITSPPKTWDEYAADAQKIKAAYPSSYMSTSPTSFGNYLSAVAEQNGALWFSHTASTWNVHINDDATKQVVQYWQQLIDKGLVKNESPFSTGFNSDLPAGKFAAYVGASWTDALIRSAAPKLTGKWRVAPLPQSSGTSVGGNWGGSSMAVMAGCKYPKQAAEFAVWFNSNLSNVSTLVNLGYGWPAVADPSQVEAVKSAPEVFKYYGGQNINTVFAAADQTSNHNWTSVPTATQAYQELTTKLTTSSDTVGVLDQVQNETVSRLKQRGLTVTTN